MFKNLVSSFGIVTLLFLLNVVPVFAHAVVKPNQVGVASFNDFSLGVPSERNVATVNIKLFLPSGLNNVSPIVKPGWKIEVKTSPGESLPDDDGMLKPEPVEINWSGGQIPAGQKDFFMFSAQAPLQKGELEWKIEQSYADGSVVSWSISSPDQQPKNEVGKPDFSKFGPSSKTMVMNDLQSPKPMEDKKNTDQTQDFGQKMALPLSLAAIGIAVVSFVIQTRSRKKI